MSMTNHGLVPLISLVIKVYGSHSNLFFLRRMIKLKVRFALEQPRIYVSSIKLGELQFGKLGVSWLVIMIVTTSLPILSSMLMVLLRLILGFTVNPFCKIDQQLLQTV